MSIIRISKFTLGPRSIVLPTGFSYGVRWNWFPCIRTCLLHSIQPYQLQFEQTFPTLIRITLSVDYYLIS